MSDIHASDNRAFSAHSFNLFLNEKKLMAARCTHCGRLYLPPRALCPACPTSPMEWVELSGKGKLAAYTSVYVGPSFMNNQGFGRDNPYLTGIVELEEGVKISARILGFDAKAPQQVAIGASLHITFIETGEGDARKNILAFQV